MEYPDPVIISYCLTLFQYSVLISSLAKRAKSIVRDLDPTNELRYLRIRSRKHEVTVVCYWESVID